MKHPQSRKEKERQKKIDEIFKNSKKAKELGPSYPEDQPRMSSFARDNPEVHNQIQNPSQDV